MNFAKNLYSFIKRNSILFLTLFLIIFPLLLSFHLLVFNTSYYDKEFQKNHVYEIYPKSEVTAAVRDLFQYLQNKGALENSFFNQKEKTHLADVKNLIQKTRYVFYSVTLIILIIIISLGTLKKYVKLGKFFVYGGIFSIIFLMLLSSSLVFFKPFFYSFHLLFFKNDLWLLDPKIDNLINLFPEQFFFDITRDILLLSAIISLLIIMAGIFLKKNLQRAAA